MKRYLVPYLLLLSMAFAAPANADLIPPDVVECQGKQLGQACSTGTCQNATCSRLDYAHWDRDAMPNSPPTMEYDCLKCVTGGKPGTDAGKKPSTDAGKKPDAARAEGGIALQPKGSGCSSCSLGTRETSLGRRGMALLLASVVPLLLRRRRARSL